MGADHDALAALDADIGVPSGHFVADVALFVLSGAIGEGAVGGHGANGEVVPFPGHDFAQHIPHEGGRIVGHPLVGGGVALGRANGDFEQVFQGAVYRLHVHGDDFFTLLAVGFADGFLNGCDGLIPGHHPGQGEEAHLHDGVDAVAHAGVARHLVGIDAVDLQPLVDDLLLQLLGQAYPGFLRVIKGGVDQEGGTGFGGLEQIQLFDEFPLVAGHEVGAVDQVGGADGIRAKPQVGYGDGAGLFGVVNEVALGVVVGITADDFDGVLVGPHRAIGPQTVEHGTHHAVGFRLVVGVVIDGGEGDIIHNAHGEVVLGIGLGQVVEHPLDHGRGEFFGGEAVATADDPGIHGPGHLEVGIFLIPFQVHSALGFGQFVDGVDHIQIHGFAGAAGFLGAVQHGDGLHRFGGRAFMKAMLSKGR